VIDDAEAKLADEWIDDRHHDPGRDRRHYQAMSQFTLAPGALAAVEIDRGADLP
jgi:hypothetical protein